MNSVADLASNKRPVVVIGGGVVGVCCAYYLQLAGIPVLLVDASSLGGGASYGNLGLIAVSHSVPLAAPGVIAQAIRWLFQPNSPFGIDLPPNSSTMRWLWQFYRATTSPQFAHRAKALTSMCLESVELFEELSRTLHFHRQSSGTLEVFSRPETSLKFEQQLPVMRAAGIEVEVLDPSRVQVLAPLLQDGISGGAFYPRDCVVDPVSFVDGVRLQLRAMGTILHENARVVGLRAERNHITGIDFADGSTEVAGVVLATGFETSHLLKSLGVHLPVQSARGYTFDFPIEADWPRIPIMFAEARLLATPLEGRHRLGGYLHLAGNNRPHQNVSVEALTDPLIPYLGKTIVEELRRTASPVWSGNRPCSPDGLPIIGPVAQYDNLCLATAHGMLGLTLAPVTGKIVAQTLQGKETAATRAMFGPSRF